MIGSLPVEPPTHRAADYGPPPESTCLITVEIEIEM
jgi:hypothetical protein